MELLIALVAAYFLVEKGVLDPIADMRGKERPSVARARARREAAEERAAARALRPEPGPLGRFFRKWWGAEWDAAADDINRKLDDRKQRKAEKAARKFNDRIVEPAPDVDEASAPDGGGAEVPEVEEAEAPGVEVPRPEDVFETGFCKLCGGEFPFADLQPLDEAGGDRREACAPCRVKWKWGGGPATAPETVPDPAPAPAPETVPDPAPAPAPAPETVADPVPVAETVTVKEAEGRCWFCCQTFPISDLRHAKSDSGSPELACPSCLADRGLVALGPDEIVHVKLRQCVQCRKLTDVNDLMEVHRDGGIVEMCPGCVGLSNAKDVANCWRCGRPTLLCDLRGSEPMCLNCRDAHAWESRERPAPPADAAPAREPGTRPTPPTDSAAPTGDGNTDDAPALVGKVVDRSAVYGGSLTHTEGTTTMSVTPIDNFSNDEAQRYTGQVAVLMRALLGGLETSITTVAAADVTGPALDRMNVAMERIAGVIADMEASYAEFGTHRGVEDQYHAVGGHAADKRSLLNG